MSEKNTYFWLKALVFTMGIVLIVGTITMMFFVYTVVFERGGAPSAAAPITCKDAQVDITGRGKLVAAAVENGNAVSLLKTSDGNFELVTVDGCSGEITRTVTLNTVE